MSVRLGSSEYWAAFRCNMLQWFHSALAKEALSTPLGVEQTFDWFKLDWVIFKQFELLRNRLYSLKNVLLERWLEDQPQNWDHQEKLLEIAETCVIKKREARVSVIWLKGLGHYSLKRGRLVTINTQVLVNLLHAISVYDLNLSLFEAVADIMTFCQRNVALEPLESSYQAPVTKHESVYVL